MASGHHQCHCHLHHLPPTTAPCYYCTTTLYSPLPLIHHLHAPPHNHHSIHTHHHDYYPPQTHHQKPRLSHKYRQQEEDDHQDPPPPTVSVSSLIHRIAVLESSLHRRHSPPRYSLRDAAARTIQTHFRAFLVRRSKTLRHLKDLAFIKSSLNTLKSSLSAKTHFDSHLVSRESMNLLIKLDSIQGGDPMIRDGKRSISRELIRFMEFIDEISPKSRVISVKNVRFGGKNPNRPVVLQREQKIRASDSRVFDGDAKKILEKLRNQVQKNNGFAMTSKVEEEEEDLELENPRVYINGKSGLSVNKIGGLLKSQLNVKKNVSFNENGNVYRVIRSTHGHVSSDESDSINGDREIEETSVHSTEIRNEEEEESLDMSDNEVDPRKNLRIKKQQPEEEDDDDDEDDEDDESFVFSAPLPVKMEYRVD